MQCFSFAFFKDTSLRYVRAAQGSFILKHWNLLHYQCSEIELTHYICLGCGLFISHKDTGMVSLFVCECVTEMQEMTSCCPHCS